MLRSDYNVNEKSPIRVSTSPTGLFSDIPISFISHPQTKDIRPITDIQAIRQSVQILVLSSTTDRPFRPDLGGNVATYLFENATQLTALGIRDEIVRVLERNEPRISNITVLVDLDQDRNQMLVTIAFEIKGTQQNTEISFYLDRIR
jgi:phage baseplate assembly protein W